jgi:pimeloyl-ACP methyl ester carboxylesterase
MKPVLVLLLALLVVPWAQAKDKRAKTEEIRLEEFRGDLFSNAQRKVLESKDQGAALIYDWNYQESVLDRDEVEGTVAKAERVDTAVASSRKDHVLHFGPYSLDTYQVGEVEGSRFAVIFIHGAQGTKAIGANDVSFGGNFNHVQSLALHNRGVYFSPTVSLDVNGALAVAAMITEIKKTAPRSKIVLACGSAGAFVCWQIGRMNEGAKLSGLVLLGGASFDPNFKTSPAGQSRVPVLFSHGTKDPLVPGAYVTNNYAVVREVARNYPVRLEMYNGGKHGTPLRLIDWKEVLEWMFNGSSR